MESLTATAPGVTGSGSGNRLTARCRVPRPRDDCAGYAGRVNGTFAVAFPVGSRCPVPVGRATGSLAGVSGGVAPDGTGHARSRCRLVPAGDPVASSVPVLPAPADPGCFRRVGERVGGRATGGTGAEANAGSGSDRRDLDPALLLGSAPPAPLRLVRWTGLTRPRAGAAPCGRSLGCRTDGQGRRR